MDALSTCTLCGFQFDPRKEGCKSGCPMSSGCKLVCCPNCGHGMPAEGTLATGLRKLLVRLGRHP